MGSLFDGIGGFPLAARHNGVIPLWASEIEPFPIRVTQQRLPGMLHYGDITKLDGAMLPPVDISGTRDAGRSSSRRSSETISSTK